MKKINSIHYGGKVLLVGALFLSVFPLGIIGLNLVLDSEILSVATKIVFCTGVLIIGFFFIHLIIEFWQDKKIEQYYASHKNVKIQIQGNGYECGACGSRNLKDKSKWCNVCGCQFGEYEDKMPQDIIGKSTSIMQDES